MKYLVNVLFVLLIVGSIVACKSQKETIDGQQTEQTQQAERRGSRQGPPSMEKVFQMDSNNDGKLSKTEVKGRLQKDFDKIDTDKDGFITKEEFEKAPKPSKGQRPPRN